MPEADLPPDGLDDVNSDRASAPATPCSLDRALDLVRFLRANCDWDAEQTPESLVRHLLEEAHEVAQAVHAGESEILVGELGDLLLNLAFQIVIAEERSRFTAEDVVSGLEEKMRRRHPHLYGLGESEPWEVLKARERAPSTSVLDGVPDGFDPLHKAYRLQELASGVGFDWPDVAPALAKVDEEANEVREELTSASGAATGSPLADELGDLLFAVINVVRLAGHQPAAVLARANSKFDDRFRRLEILARSEGRTLPGPSLQELDDYWERVKRGDGSPGTS